MCSCSLTTASASPKRPISSAKDCHGQGWEGAILRCPSGPYKYGRSTVVEQRTNKNEATLDELGHTKRSTAEAGKVGNGTLGACLVKWFNGKEIVEFSLAAGGTNEEVAELWAQRDAFPGQIVTFKYVGVGANGRPRYPIWPKFDFEVTGEVAAIVHMRPA